MPGSISPTPHPEGVVEATLRDIANGILDGGPEGGLGATRAWTEHVVEILREVYEYGRTGKRPPNTDGRQVLTFVMPADPGNPDDMEAARRWQAELDDEPFDNTPRPDDRLSPKPRRRTVAFARLEALLKAHGGTMVVRCDADGWTVEFTRMWKQGVPAPRTGRGRSLLAAIENALDGIGLEG